MRDAREGVTVETICRHAGSVDTCGRTYGARQRSELFAPCVALACRLPSETFRLLFEGQRDAREPSPLRIEKEMTKVAHASIEMTKVAHASERQCEGDQ